MRDVTFRAWRRRELGDGTASGLVLGHDGLAIGSPHGTRSYADPFGSRGPVDYDTATWTSPAVDPGHPWTELVASWNATTPDGTWVEIRVRATTDDGTWGGWFVLARWASHDPDEGGALHRTTVTGQATSEAQVRTDTLKPVGGHTFSAWQVRAELLRRAGTTATPTLHVVGVVASAVPQADASTSRPGTGLGVELDVPTLSQEVHRGHYPQWDDGGEAWCSPTSTAMVLGFWGVGPTSAQTAWVQPPVDAVVDHAARHVFDHGYGGAGNWPFNAAYAACFGLEGFVTRLRSLAEAEAFVAAGIPLVASVSFAEGELTGAGYGTNGHLLVIRGFTSNGDVVVNDPAAHLVADNARVRVVYDRGELETAWLRGSAGIVYVIRPPDHPLPPARSQPNW